MRKPPKYYIFYIKYVIFRDRKAKDTRVIYSIRNESRNIYHTHTGGGKQ
jgi:hypothetical protein